MAEGGHAAGRQVALQTAQFPQTPSQIVAPLPFADPEDCERGGASLCFLPRAPVGDVTTNTDRIWMPLETVQDFLKIAGLGDSVVVEKRDDAPRSAFHAIIPLPRKPAMLTRRQVVT